MATSCTRAAILIFIAAAIADGFVKLLQLVCIQCTSVLSDYCRAYQHIAVATAGAIESHSAAERPTTELICYSVAAAIGGYSMNSDPAARLRS